jgi:dienelactone hydrolase
VRIKELEQYIGKTPELHYIPTYDPKPETDWYGIKALWYDGPTYKGQKTKVFAYIGYPQTKSQEKVPAVVLVHGGGGHAYSEWIRRWNEKGFAAIAMELCGYLPDRQWIGLLGTEENKDPRYVHTLYGELSEAGYTLGPDNVEMADSALPLEEQWMYHAVADTILAHNILRNDEKIDAAKIGITGISWGGVVASIAIGYDTRYAFAIPLYGSGYIDRTPSPRGLPYLFHDPIVQKNWSAADRLYRVNFPVFWQCWRKDRCFSPLGNSLSYINTKKANAFLSISATIGHSHKCGWNAPESYRFAERILSGKLPFIKASEEPSDFAPFSIPLQIPEDFTDIKISLVYTDSPITYDENDVLTNEWKTCPLTLQGNTVHGEAPRSARCYYLEMSGKADGVLYSSTTPLVNWAP